MRRIYRQQHVLEQRAGGNFQHARKHDSPNPLPPMRLADVHVFNPADFANGENSDVRDRLAIFQSQ